MATAPAQKPSPATLAPRWASNPKEANPGEYRLAINGAVVSSNDWSESLEHIFFTHLKNALTEPEDFEFVGVCGKQDPVEWLEHHRKRLKLKTWKDTEIAVIDKEGRVIDAFTTAAA